MGSKIFKFQDDDIVIEYVVFKETFGLFKLVFLKSPKQLT